MLPPEQFQKISEQANIAAQFTYVEDLLKKYDWNPQRKSEIEKRILQGRQKQHGQHLYLGIIGEFSAGKSTLINCLMRTSFLKMENLQGTTTTAIYFKYGQTVDLEVRYTDGKVLSFGKHSRQFSDLYPGYDTNPGTHKSLWGEFLQWVQRLWNPTPKAEKISRLTRLLSSSEEISKTISQMTVYYPSAKLMKDLVIIDTPGLNSLNKRHKEVSEGVLRDQCDAILVIIQSTSPASEMITDFLYRYSNEIPLHRCIFVVTKIDQVPRQEHSRLVENIKCKLAETLNIPNPRVIAFSALLTLEETVPNVNKTGLFVKLDAAERKYLLDGFLRGEQEIVQSMREERLLIQMERTMSIINLLYTGLQEDLKGFEETFLKQKEDLDARRIKDLPSFISDKKALHERLLDEEAIDLFSRTAILIDAAWEKFSKARVADLYNATSTRELKGKIERIPLLINSYQEQLKPYLSSIHQEVPAMIQKQKENFEVAFTQLYTTLTSLDTPLPGSPVYNPGGTYTYSDPGALDNVASAIKDVNFNKGLAQGASAAAGAGIGTLVFPGIGTVIGGVIGWLTGELFGPSLSEVRAKCTPPLQTELQKVVTALQEAGKKSLEGTMTQGKESLSGIIDLYMGKYDDLVNSMIEKQRLEMVHLEKLYHQVAEDLKTLEARNASLTQLQSVIKNS